MAISDGEVLFDTEYANLREAASGNATMEGLGVTQRGAGANMSVDVAAGDAWSDDVYVNKAATTNVVVTASHASLDRIDIVTMDSAGTISVTAGTPAANPSPPNLPADEIMFAYVSVPATVVTIINAYITDKREFVKGAREPLGSVKAWLKSFTGSIALSYGWVECNGQVLSDSASPYDGETIPDLNASAGTARFLRGSTTSGATGGSETHAHAIPAGGPISNAGVLGASGTSATSTLPSYYEVVWIMKVKY